MNICFKQVEATVSWKHRSYSKWVDYMLFLDMMFGASICLRAKLDSLSQDSGIRPLAGLEHFLGIHSNSKPSDESKKQTGLAWILATKHGTIQDSKSPNNPEFDNIIRIWWYCSNNCCNLWWLNDHHWGVQKTRVFFERRNDDPSIALHLYNH